ncbi:helix-turn-helix domain-containing protein [Robertmurraya sp. P23]|uniref:helix-turn-helix domain-containing protein n=1 Tax=Robertmurraya sp. P23 TaxID=3436931 RepID=UPI003D974516
MSNILDLIGKRVRTIRKLKGLTQEQLAEKTGLQETYIGGIERGERNISLETLEKISIGLEITPGFLFQHNSIDFEKEKNKKEFLTDLCYSLQCMSIDELMLISKIINSVTDYTNTNLK